MKTLILMMLCFATASVTASADWGRPPPPPGWGHGGGPGWGPGHGGPGWGHGGPGWGPGHGGPGWGPGGPGWGPGGPGGPGWGQPPRQQYVQCSSGGYSYNQCAVNGEIINARLVSQDSFAACELGRSWGYQRNVIWVDRGCRGTFLVEMY